MGFGCPGSPVVPLRPFILRCLGLKSKSTDAGTSAGSGLAAAAAARQPVHETGWQD